MTGAPWNGAWVSEQLGITLKTTASCSGLTLEDLVGLAVRRNPRRAHLLVSTVLGKHVCADPALVHGMGLLLGVLAGQALNHHPRQTPADGDLVARALNGSDGAANELVASCRAVRVPMPAGTVVLGFAETATGLGHCVAEQLRADTVHSTRRHVPGVAPALAFEEAHSHATSHRILAPDSILVAGSGPVVLVDDELSTGATAENTIRALHRSSPRSHYVIAALVDLRDAADQARCDSLATELGVVIDVVSLVSGLVHLPEGVLGAGSDLARLIGPLEPRSADAVTAADSTLTRHVATWPTDVRDSGRHGMTPQHRDELGQAVTTLAIDCAPALTHASRVHVLGTEELMYLPMLLAEALATATGATVTFSSTTRSPVVVREEPGYAITSGIAFTAHDDPADGPGLRYAYNIPAGVPTVVVVDSPADGPALVAPDGLLSQLRTLSPHVTLVVVPSFRPPAGDAP